MTTTDTLAALKAAHGALDFMLAERIEADPTFYPTKHRMWPVVEQAHRAITAAEARIAQHREDAKPGGCGVLDGGQWEDRAVAAEARVETLTAALRAADRCFHGLSRDETLDGDDPDWAIVQAALADAPTAAPAPTAGVTEAEIENAVRGAMNTLPMGTFGQIIDHAVRKLALDNVQLRAALAAASVPR